MIEIKQGNVFDHPAPYILAHCCNNIGKWGAGFTHSLDRFSTVPRDSYKEWYERENQKSYKMCRLPLGKTQFVKVADIYIANIIGQNGVRTAKNNKPVKYDAIKKGLETVKRFAQEKNRAICSPLLGTKLAGGSVERIYGIIHDLFSKDDVPLYTLYAYTQEDYDELAEIRETYLTNNVGFIT